MSRKCLEVLWSDGSTIVLNKPSGLAVQDIPVRINRMLRRPCHLPVWLPHRIDKYTRGLQVVTVCKEACRALNRSSEQRRWRKRYRALTCIPSGSDLENSPLIRADGSLVREGWLVSGMLRRQLCPARHEVLHPYVPNNMLFDACQLRLVESEGEPRSEDYGRGDSHRVGTNNRVRGDRGVWACTHFRLAHVSNCKRYAAYEVSLSTGRTHQIRVHFATAKFPLANDFYYNEASFYIAETFRFRASAVQRENRWPADSDLLVPPAPEPWLSMHGEPGRVPWRGRQSATNASASSNCTGVEREHVHRIRKSSVQKGIGEPRQIAQPLPQALELGLQAHSLHLPVPAPANVEGHGQAIESGIQVELPWPVNWNLGRGDDGSECERLLESATVIERTSASVPDAGCTVRPWQISSDAPVTKANRRKRRRNNRQRKQALRGLVLTDLLEMEQDPASLAQQFTRWGSVTNVSVRQSKANVVALLEFGGSHDERRRAVENTIAQHETGVHSKWRGRLHRWNL